MVGLHLQELLREKQTRSGSEGLKKFVSYFSPCFSWRVDISQYNQYYNKLPDILAEILNMNHVVARRSCSSLAPPVRAGEPKQFLNNKGLLRREEQVPSSQ
jgi:hypothetical protein